MRRHRMGKGSSKRSFTKHAVKTHVKNTVGARVVMRGGIRL